LKKQSEDHPAIENNSLNRPLDIKGPLQNENQSLPPLSSNTLKLYNQNG